MSSSSNPVARICSTITGKGKRSHYGENIPLTCLLCVGALVSIAGKNINPTWGLHNGALGYVWHIAFDNGESPNNGDLPLYVVVEFHSYVGPAWYQENPKVSHCAVHQL